MFDLVIGGSGSGKSEFAEGCCRNPAPGGKLYIATMEPFGQEGAARIARHHKLRAGKGFYTLECYTHLEEAEIPEHATVLLECMSNLTANEMFSPDGRKEEITAWILKGIRHILAHADHLVVVSNDIFCDGTDYDPETLRYMQLLSEVNRELAVLADRVYEVVCGIPLLRKGETGSSGQATFLSMEDTRKFK